MGNVIFKCVPPISPVHCEEEILFYPQIVLNTFVFTHPNSASLQRLHIEGQMVIRQQRRCKKTAMPHNISAAASHPSLTSSSFGHHAQNSGEAGSGTWIKVPISIPASKSM